MLKQPGFQLDHSIITLKEVKVLRKEAKIYVDGGAPFWINAMYIVSTMGNLTDKMLQSAINNYFTKDEINEIKKVL